MSSAIASLVRQPFPKSPVSTDNSTTPSPTSTWTSFSATTSHVSSPSPKQYHALYPPSISKTSTQTTIKHHENSWAEEDTPSHLDTPVVFRRARSPSAPILPSQLQTHIQPTPHHARDEGSLQRFDQLSIGGQGVSFPQYEPRPFPGDSVPPQEHQHSMIGNRNEEDDIFSIYPAHRNGPTRFNVFPRSTPHGYDSTLTHHASEPDFIPGHAGLHIRQSEDNLTSTTQPNRRGKNVYIADVVPDMTEAELKKIGYKFGNVLMVRIQAVKDGSADVIPNGLSWEPKAPRHCAFVLFDHHSSAAAMIKYHQARGVPCDFAKEDFQTEWKSREDPDSANLYIQGLPLDTSEWELKSLLEPYGTVVSWRFLLSGERHRRGPALARLECRPQADAAIQDLNNANWRGHVLQVRIADSDKQKDFKRDANNSWSDGNSVSRNNLHRQSLPQTSSLHAGQVAHLDHIRRQLVEQLEAVEAQKANLFTPSKPYTLRGYDRDDRATPFATYQESSPYEGSPSRLFFGRQTSMSSLHTNRTASIQSTNTTIWTPPASRNASTRFTGYPHDWSSHVHTPTHVKDQGDSLHRIRSTPELGADVPARLLWPGHANELDSI